MYDTHRINPDTGKRILTARYSEFFRNESAIPVPCGHCIACRERKASEWRKRLALESHLHDSCSWFTLTYNDSNIPSDRLASKRDIQLFMKRFRNVSRDFGISLAGIKYFIVCEYGSKSRRPHYHGIIFGVDFLSDCWCPRLVGLKAKYGLYSSSVLEQVWNRGFVLVDRLVGKSLNYVTKYLLKSDTWSLKSMGLGKGLFVNDDGLTPLCRSLYPSGRMSIFAPSLLSGIPRFVDRFVERFDSSLYDLVHARRCEYVSKLPLRDLSAVRDGIILNRGNKGKLDNE